MESITQAMNNIILDEEEEEVLALEDDNVNEQGKAQFVCDAKLCLVGRFLTEGIMDFQAIQQTLAALWRPGKGVYIKELDVNLFLFQFYHEIDINRVIEGSPWTFNRKVLIISRMKEGDNPRCVPLNTIDLWVQIHDLQPGFMSDKVFSEVGNQVGKYICSCPSNFKGVWRDYMRIRVTMNLSKPLKRRMKLRKSGNEWVWITFKYENVHVFCFICGLLGHSDKFCSQLFEKPENEIVRPYGIWMRAPLRRQTKLIGAKWLRTGGDDFTTAEMGTWGSSQQQNPVVSGKGVDLGAKITDMNVDRNRIESSTDNMQLVGDNSVTSNLNVQISGEKIGKAGKRNVTIMENKKRRTDSGHVIGPNTELDVDSEGEEWENMDQESEGGSKNVNGAGSEDRARLAL